ncbi:MAG: hypothetical protein K6D97_07940 [Clostridia bacterium]|nr:hypothetical protein [Clostridia bacterium]
MKNIYALTKVFIEENLFRNFEKNRKRKLIIYALVYAYLCGMVLSISYSCIEGLKAYGEEKIFIDVLLIAYLLLISIRLIFSSMNVLYYSNDNDVISTYPVREKDIVFSKMLTILFTEYIFEILVFIPSLVMYGIMCNMGALYYVHLALVGLMFPIIPIAVFSFVVSVVIGLFKFIRNKESVQYFAILLVFGFMIVVNLLISGNAENEITNDDIARTLISYNQRMENTFKFFPGIKIYADSLKNVAGIVNLKLIMAMVLSGIAFYLFGSVVAHFYMNTLISMNSSFRTRKNKRVIFTQKRIASSYFRKELKIWFRHPLFLMQCILPPIIFPIIFMIPANASMKITESNASVLFISKVFMEQEGILGLIVSVFILNMMFLFNYTASVCISKDGKDAIFMKYIPVEYSKQCIYKIFISLILNMFPIIYLVLIEKFLLIGIPLKIIAYIVCIAVVMGVYTNMKGIQIDLKNPKIDWGNEYAVVKQNFNIMIQMAVNFLVFMVAGVGVFLLYAFLNIDLAAIITIVIFVLLIIKNYKKFDNQPKLFEEVE